MVKTSTFVAALAAILALALAIALSSGWFGEGLDSVNYIRIFADIQFVNSVWDLRYEPLFFFFVRIVSIPTTEPKWIFFAIIATALLTKIIAVHQAKANALIFLISYFSLWGATFELNQIRVALALGWLLLIVSSRRLGTRAVLLLSPFTLGLHYSMIGPIAAIFAYFIIFSNLTLLRKFIILSMAALIAYLLFLFIDARLSTYLMAVAATMQTEDIRLFSFFSLYVMLVSTFAVVYLIQHRGPPPPRAVTISIISAISGILIFYYQTISGGLYAYRVLETMTGLIPIVLAWVWSNTESRHWKSGVLALILVGLAIAPKYWASLSI